MAPQKQLRLLSRRPEIVVATPGRLWDLIREGNEHLSTVREIGYLAIDETDRMAEKGHFQELHHLLEMLNEAGEGGGGDKPAPQRQNLVFSATLSLVHEAPAHVKSKKGKKKKLTSAEKLQEVGGMPMRRSLRVRLPDPWFFSFQIMTLVGMKSRRKVVDLTRKVGTAETLVESKIQCSQQEKDFYLYYFTQVIAVST